MQQQQQQKKKKKKKNQKIKKLLEDIKMLQVNFIITYIILTQPSLKLLEF